MDLQAVSRYPFRSEAQEWVRSQGVSLADVLGNPVYSRVVEEGRDRVLEAMTEEGLRDRTAHDEVEALISVLSYPIARMLVSAIGDLLLVRRYALREAKATYEHLVREEPYFLMELAQDELGVPAELVDTGDGPLFTLHFTDFLKNASALRAKAWKLHNQDLQAGQVLLSPPRFARLLQEALRRRIEAELPLEVNEAILGRLEDEMGEVVAGLESLRQTIQKDSYGEFSLDYMAPCMRDLLEKTQQGVNLPHVARFALTAFLSHVGLGVEDVIELYRVSSDFKESIASYQVRHILGEISGTKYNPPSCSTMQTYGICLRDPRCEQAGSPLRYYFRQQRRTERESGRESGEAPDAGETEDEGEGEGGESQREAGTAGPERNKEPDDRTRPKGRAGGRLKPHG